MNNYCEVRTEKDAVNEISFDKMREIYKKNGKKAVEKFISKSSYREGSFISFSDNEDFINIEGVFIIGRKHIDIDYNIGITYELYENKDMTPFTKNKINTDITIRHLLESSMTEIESLCNSICKTIFEIQKMKKKPFISVAHIED